MTQGIFRISVFYFLLLILSSACKTKKEIRETKRNTDERVDVKAPRTLMKLLKENQFDFSWLSAKFSADINLDGNMESFNGTRSEERRVGKECRL